VKGVWRQQWQIDAWGETPANNNNKKSISVNKEQKPEKFTLEISHNNLTVKLTDNWNQVPKEVGSGRSSVTSNLQMQPRCFHGRLLRNTLFFQSRARKSYAGLAPEATASIKPKTT